MTLTANALFSSPPEHITAAAEDAFFRAIKNSNRTFKFTGAARLAELDSALVDYLGRVDARVSTVLDVGISSGVTTLEMVERLRQADRTVQVTATDLTLRAYIGPVLPGCRALVDPQGHILQYEFFGRAMNPWRRRLDYLTGMVFVRAVAHWLCDDRARSAIRAGGKGHWREIALVTPRLTARNDVTVIEDDIMIRNTAFVGRFDLVRAANILNTGYFTERSLRKGLAHVVSYLSGPGALLLIARTLERTGNHATLFEVSPDGQRLLVAERFGNGSEVEDLALETRLPGPAALAGRDA